MPYRVSNARQKTKKQEKERMAKYKTKEKYRNFAEGGADLVVEFVGFQQ